MQSFLESLSPASPERPTCARLEQHAVFAASGAEALAFLHGQLTQDVETLPVNAARLAGYCSAKGRLLSTLILWRAVTDSTPDAPQLYGLIQRDVADALLKRLSMFILRTQAKLTLTPLHVLGVQADAQQCTRLEALIGALPRLAWARVEHPCGTWIAAPSADAQLRWWWVASDEQLQAAAPLHSVLSAAPPAPWCLADLAAGLPWIGAATQDLFIPQTVNLDLIEGISFTKGCYPGQEVVARSHYRGTVKRRMAYGQLQHRVDAPWIGLDVYDANKPAEPVGRIINASQASEHIAALFEITLAALSGGDLRLGSATGPRIAHKPLPYSIQTP